MRETGGVEDEHAVEAVIHRVLDQTLESRALVREPAGLEVEVLLAEGESMVGGVAGDGLALPVGGVATPLLLGGLADVGDRAACWLVWHVLLLPSVGGLVCEQLRSVAAPVGDEPCDERLVIGVCKTPLLTADARHATLGSPRRSRWLPGPA